MEEWWPAGLAGVRSKCDGLVALGIYGDNGVAWTREGVDCTPAETALLAAAFKGDMEVFNSGFTLGGNRFVMTKHDQEDYVLIGKGRKEGNVWSTGPFCAMKINGAIVFAVGNSDVQGGAVNTAVAHIAEYLRDNGYGVV